MQFKNLLKGQGTFNINNINYLNRIINKGYFRNGKVLQKEIQFQFQNFYNGVSNQYLSLRISDSHNWIGNVIHHPKKVFNPFQHLLFHRFIELLDLKPLPPRKDHPFGIGPWKCFNKSTSHYLQEVITELVVEEDKKNKRKVGIFKCRCGMVYSKYFTNTGGILRENIRVKERGEEWEKKLNECISNQLSLRETARILGTDPSTISKIIEKIKKPKGRYNIGGLVASKRAEWESALNSIR